MVSSSLQNLSHHIDQCWSWRSEVTSPVGVKKRQRNGKRTSFPISVCYLLKGMFCSNILYSVMLSVVSRSLVGRVSHAQVTRRDKRPKCPDIPEFWTSH